MTVYRPNATIPLPSVKTIACDLIDILQYKQKMQEGLNIAIERENEVMEELHSEMESSKLDTYTSNDYTFTRNKGTIKITTNA